MYKKSARQLPCGALSFDSSEQAELQGFHRLTRNETNLVKRDRSPQYIQELALRHVDYVKREKER